MVGASPTMTARPRSDLRPKAKVLLVEDEAVIAEDLREYLYCLGYDVMGLVRSAAAAVRAIEQQRVDLVLMDISLRGRLEGIEATVEIEDRFGVPVIYLSGCTWPEIAARVVCSQPSGFVAKPYDSTHLARVIARVLQGPGAMAGSPLAH